MIHLIGIRKISVWKSRQECLEENLKVWSTQFNCTVDSVQISVGSSLEFEVLLMNDITECLLLLTSVYLNAA